MNNEQQLLYLKQNTPFILEGLIGMMNVQDSLQFCLDVINKTKSSGKIALDNTQVDTNFQASDFKQYQVQIATVIAAIKASYSGDVNSLKNLKSKNVDLNQGDYDQRTPLHWAVRGNKTEAVRYLVTVAGVKVNPVDRWGSTPLNYFMYNKYAEIKSILEQNGAKQGASLPSNFRPRRTLNMTDNEFRLQYAALNNDVRIAELLIQLGAGIDARDIDRRTPLQVAAGKGHVEMVQYLAFKGASLTMSDSRNHTAMDEAKRLNFIKCDELLDSIISDSIIKKNCLTFHDGILKQGMQGAIGNFHKKFSDLYIDITYASTYQERLQILLGQSSTPSAANQTFNALQTYQQIQELFLSRILDIVITKLAASLTTYNDKYNQQTMGIFILFIVFQLFALLVLRANLITQLKSDILESRGILTLIPNHIIEQNKNIVEKIITKLKD